MNQDGRSVWTLVAFTLHTQMAVGAFVLWGLTAVLLPTPSPISVGQFPFIVLITLLLILILGALAAAFHLGRPMGAVFSLTNLHRSWLSREGLLGIGFGLLILILFFFRWRRVEFGPLDRIIILIGIACGISLVYGISRLYMLRTVPAWNHLGTPASFYTTSFLLGTLTVMVLWNLLISSNDAYANDIILSRLATISNSLITLLVGVQAVIFGAVSLYLNHMGGAAGDSVRVLWTKLRGILIGRWLTAGIGVTILVLFPPRLFVMSAYVLLLISEILGRYLFYGFYRRTGY
jgi:anaerobic dimethyl sulfoxide reductase subunit C (anchor subunit)